MSYIDPLTPILSPTGRALTSHPSPARSLTPRPSPTRGEGSFVAEIPPLPSRERGLGGEGFLGEGPGGILSVRMGPGANCSSVGSVVDMLFVVGALGGALLVAVTAALSSEPIEMMGVVPKDTNQTERSREHHARED